MGKEREPSAAAKRLVPKIIAVGAEWGANTVLPISAAAFSSDRPDVGALFLGIYAAFLAAKNWAQDKSAAETQAPVETFLSSLLANHKNLTDAVDAIATEHSLHEFVSRERALELQKVLHHSQEEIEQKISESQEITFYLATFLDTWCDKNGKSIETIELEVLPRIEKKIDDGFSQSRRDNREILDKLAEIEKRIVASPVLPGAVPPIVEVRVISVSRELTGLPAGPVERADTIDVDELRRLMLAASRSLLDWPASVGRSRRRIPPKLEESILETFDSESSSTGLVLGAKGSGKSALAAAVGMEALKRGFVILGIRADKIPADIVSADDLIEALANLHVRPADAVRLVAKTQRVLLLLDQLDSVSELTDRRSKRLNYLLNLIRELAGTRNVHILAACREFDHRHDARLSTIDADELQLTLPDWPQVAEVLRVEGHEPDKMAEPMRELLRVPWNLNLFLRVAKPGDIFASQQSLIEAIWSKSVVDAGGPPRRVELLERIALQMSEQEELFVPRALADDFSAECDALLHEEILITEAVGRALAFRHQTFYDYTLARLFARGKKSLAEHVLAHQDGLFVRPALLNGLELLRDSSRSEYHRQVHQILASSPRQHIRTLLLEFLARQSEPDDSESGIILPLLKSDDGGVILRAAAGSAGWLKRFRDSGELNWWMRQPPERAIFALGLLIGALRVDGVSIYELVEANWLPEEKYDRLLIGVANNLSAWDEKWAGAVCTVALRSPVGAVWIAERIVDAHPKIAAKLIRAELDRKLSAATAIAATKPPDKVESDNPIAAYWMQRMKNPFGELLESADNDWYGLEVIAEKAPIELAEVMWPWLVEVLKKMDLLTSGRREMYSEDWVTDRAYDVHPMPLIQAMHTAADGWASRDPKTFAAFALSVANIELLAAHRVLAQAFAVAAAGEPEAALEYLIADPRRLVIGTHRERHEFSIRLIAAVFPHLSTLPRARLEEAIINFDAFSQETYAEMETADRFKMKKWSREDRLRLLRAIPDNLIGKEATILRQQEEVALPGVKDDRDESSGFSIVGPRMTVEELTRASDKEVINLMDDLVAREKSGSRHRWNLEAARSGGVLAEVRAFGSLAEKEPERVLNLLKELHPERDDHQAYAGAAISGLAKSTIAATELFSQVTSLEDRGFTSDQFREDAAGGIDDRARRGEIPPATLLARLEQWLNEMTIPIWSKEEAKPSAEERAGPVIFRRGGGFSLMNGRAAVFRAISAACSRRDAPDFATLIRTVRSGAGRERHPRVMAEMLLYSQSMFTVADQIKDATAAYDAIMESCPESLHYQAAIYALAELTGYFQPEETYEKWLLRLRHSKDAWSQKTFGELLLLYYGRRLRPWAADRIAETLKTRDRRMLIGLAYGAAESWFFPHCRRVATDILCVAAEYSDKEFQEAIKTSLVPPYEDRFLVDDDTKRLIAAICKNPELLRVVGSQLLETLAPTSGTHPEVALAVSRAVLAASEGNKLPDTLGVAAANLTNIAITLHRQEAFRAAGLELFEHLLQMGLGEAAAALDLLDRKPYQPLIGVVPHRRPRRPRTRKRPK